MQNVGAGQIVSQLQQGVSATQTPIFLSGAGPFVLSIDQFVTAFQTGLAVDGSVTPVVLTLPSTNAMLTAMGNGSVNTSINIETPFTGTNVTPAAWVQLQVMNMNTASAATVTLASSDLNTSIFQTAVLASSVQVFTIGDGTTPGTINVYQQSRQPAAQPGVTSITTNSGVAVPVLGDINLFGGANMTTSAAANNVLVTLISDPTVSGTITSTSDGVGTTQSIVVSNTDSTNPNSNAAFIAETHAGGGSPQTLYSVNGGQSFVQGINAADSSALVTSASGTLGVSNVQRIDNGGNVTFYNHITAASDGVGTTQSIVVSNTDSTNSNSNAAFIAETKPGGGSPQTMYSVNGGQSFVQGINAADSSAFVTSASGTLGVSNVQRIDNGGNVTFYNHVTVPHMLAPVNSTCGIATLSGGHVTVLTTAVTANSLIFLSHDMIVASFAVIWAPSSEINPGVSFGIHSASGTDGSSIYWFIIN